ncbi:MAG: hypothetical protein K2K12_03885 [Clostridia bacterium]|nr:hypothetical protein [Clostridia bacterium]
MKNSAIKDMLNGKRGKFDQVELGAEYWECASLCSEKERSLCEKLEEYPELLRMYTELDDLEAKKNARLLEDYYAEGFSFGLSVGLETAERGQNYR